MVFRDTHAHIYLKDFDKDRDEILSRTFENGVEKIFMPNIDSRSIDKMLDVAAHYPGQCLAMMGLHPCSVKKDFEKELAIVEDYLLKNHTQFVAIGEIGTDLYWDKSLFEQQKEAFLIQINWAKQYGLPIIIHCRESIRETIDFLKPLKDEKLRGIFHCFTGTLAEAAEAVELGFHLGIGGVATFKNSGLDTVLSGIDLEHLVLETDCPYLAPVPYRGKRNETSYIPLIAQKIATVRQIPLEEVAEATTRNSISIFGT